MCIMPGGVNGETGGDAKEEEEDAAAAEERDQLARKLVSLCTSVIVATEVQADAARDAEEAGGVGGAGGAGGAGGGGAQMRGKWH